MQQTIPLFCLGPNGSNGSEAAKIAMPILQTMRPEVVFECVFASDNVSVLEKALASNGIAVIPVENGKQGLVIEVMEWRLKQTEFPLQIVGEIRLPIEHHLLVHSGVRKEMITRVVSHPQALGQCRGRLHALGLGQTIEYWSTAGAAQALSRGELPHTHAAIASMHACAEYGLVSLGEVSDVSHNETLFHVCAPWKANHQNKTKTVYMFDLPNTSDALLNVLLIMKKVNHTSLHSIPTGTLGQYSFYMESEVAHNSLDRWRFDQLQREVENLRILGSF